MCVGSNAHLNTIHLGIVHRQTCVYVYFFQSLYKHLGTRDNFLEMNYE